MKKIKKKRIFDPNNLIHRNIFTTIIGEIWPFSKEHKLSTLESISQVSDCLRNSDREIKNEITLKHKNFVSRILSFIANEIAKNKLPFSGQDCHSFITEIGETIRDTPKERFEDFIALNEKILEYHQKKDTKSMNLLFKKIETFMNVLKEIPF